MNLIPPVLDSRGRESHTLLFVAMAAMVLICKFALAGMSPFGLSVPPMSAGEFGVSFAAVLAVWLGREWTEKRAS